MATTEPSARDASIREPPWGSRIGTRVLAAFATLLVLFVFAFAVSAHSFLRISEAERELEGLELARHAADRAALLMRDQYIHQAHTLILFDHSHLEHYDHVVHDAETAIEELGGLVSAEEDAALVRIMAEHQVGSDRIFREETLPAVARADRQRARQLHERMERSVEGFSDAVLALNHRSEARAQLARAAVDTALVRARSASLVSLACALLVVMVVGTHLLTTVVRHLAALHAGALRVGAGNLSTRIGLESQDELGALARAFDDMASRLAQHQRDLVASQRLASMGRVAAGVAHELNNPLGVILGYAKLMQKRAEYDPESVSVIIDEATLASEIVSSMVDLTKPQALHRTDFVLGELVSEVSARVQKVARFQGLQWELDAGSSATVRADEPRLRQVLVNVMTNAAEAALPSGTVKVSVRFEGDLVSIRIEDSGAGLSPDLLDQVVEPFFTTKAQGAGLGLSIAHAILEAHGGALRFSRASLGGAAVEIALPRELP